VAFGGAAALPDYLSLFCRDPLKAKYKMYSYPRYGLRYGFASATGNFQRLRGRPPLVSPLKSCMGRSFTAETSVECMRFCLAIRTTMAQGQDS
jgi:hypothetical protein